MNFAITPNDAVPKTLYHYTSLDALLSIVRSKCVRASSIRFLNDRSESLKLKEDVLSYLRNRVSSIQEQQIVQFAVDWLTNAPQQSLFVSSFSERGDLLSQWRAYCPSAVGVSIGFSTQALDQQWVRNPVGDEPFFLSASVQKVRYYGPEHKEVLHKFIESLMMLEAEAAVELQGGGHINLRSLTAVLQPFGKAALGDKQAEEITRILIEAIIFAEGKPGFNLVRPPGTNLAIWVNLLSPFIKHEAFSEECEWRKVISKDVRLMPGQQYRQGKSTLVPFIDIMLDRVVRDGKGVPSDHYFINEIIVGPTPSPELTIEALNSFFESEGHPEVIIRASGVPYKDW